MILLSKELKALAPESDLVKNTFDQNIDHASYLGLSPHGGERSGTLSITSLPSAQVSDFKAAFLMLFKVNSCTNEGWKMIPSNPKSMTNALMSIYREHWSYLKYTHPFEAQASLDYLSNVATDTLKAQSLPNPLNPITYWPNQDTIEARQVQSLDFMTLGHLKLVINDRWNDLSMLFNDGLFWHLMNWDTSS